MPSGKPVPSEVEICAAMKQFLLADGWRVMEEVPLPLRGRRVDVLAIKDGVLFGVEGKVSATRSLQCQVQSLAQYCDRTAIVTATKVSEKKLQWAKAWGFGVFRYDSEGNIIHVLAQDSGAQFYRPAVKFYREKLWDWCHRHERVADVPAGSRVQAGVGPALMLLPRLKSFFQANPTAKWKDAFAQVPNHYASAASMRSALKDRMI